MLLAHKNRLKVQQPRRGKNLWCRVCDMAAPREGEKCPSCGCRSHTKRAKKYGPISEEYKF